MIPVYVYLTLISLVAHSEKEEVFMAITLLYQEQCPQFEGESTCNGTVNVFAVPVPHYPGLNISKHPKTTIRKLLSYNWLPRTRLDIIVLSF